MRIRIEFNVDEDMLKTAICCSLQKVLDLDCSAEDIKDFPADYSMPPCDIKNMIAGSCLAEIVDVYQCEFKRI